MPAIPHRLLILSNEGVGRWYDDIDRLLAIMGVEAVQRYSFSEETLRDWMWTARTPRKVQST
jgi:hypothetical protein